MEPCFPPELEREIFETLALLHPKTIPRLLLVAQRVLEWYVHETANLLLNLSKIEPLLYRVISLNSSTNDSILVPLHAKPADFFRKNVHHVLVDLGTDRNTDAVAKRLRLAVEVRSLSVVSSAGGSWAIDGESIKPLTLLSRLSISFQIAMGPVDLQFPVYGSITHLDLFDPLWEPSLLLGLGLLPALTHLSISIFTVMPSQFMQVLTACKKLMVLVLMDPDGERLFEDEPAADDDRCVLMGLSTQEYKVDWERGARGGVDFWERAEKFIQKKRRGEIEPKSRYWIVPEDDTVKALLTHSCHNP